MGERKVLNRYFPPDFDPLLVPKRKYDPYKQVEVRMMIPFSLQCIKCGEYMYRGKKFNSRKEDVIGDDYLGIKKYRFYIKCCVCNNEIAFKTDPKNQDYVCESGAWSASLFASLPPAPRPSARASPPSRHRRDPAQAPRATSSPGASRTRPRRSSRASGKKRRRRTR